jgi:hypothetical protein
LLVVRKMREGRSVSGAEERRWPRSIATVTGGREGGAVPTAVLAERELDACARGGQ